MLKAICTFRICCILYAIPQILRVKLEVGLRIDSKIENRKDSSPAGHEADINIPVGVKISVSLQLAESAGYLKLVSNDIHAQPELNFNYYSTEFDLQRGREGLLKAISLGESGYFADILDDRLQPSDEQISTEDSLNDFGTAINQSIIFLFIGFYYNSSKLRKLLRKLNYY